MRRHKEDCQFLYLRLLYTLDRPLTNDSAEFYIKRMKETSECDYIADFSKIRNDVLYVPLDENSRQCVVPLDENSRQAVLKENIFHYNIPHKHSLRNALSPYNRINYEYGIFKAELSRIYRHLFE